MNDPTRIRQLNDQPVAPHQYVLYWMQQSQRVAYNHTLEYAISQANEIGQPLIVGFGLMDDYPEANERHYAFMLEGLRDVAAGLKKRGIQFVLRRGSPPEVALKLAEEASLVVCDRGYLRHQKRWRDDVADHAKCGVMEVESDVVVPVDAVSNKHEYAARTIRPKIHRLWEKYLVELKPTTVRYPSLDLKIKSDLDAAAVDANLAKMKIDRSVPRSTHFIGGEVEAHRRLKAFIARGLDGYSERRNEPAAGATSHLSAYLHFGQISALQIALAARRAKMPSADRDAYIEELIVRRELSMNFVNFNPRYDQYECLPEWARKTLRQRREDPRAYVYSREQLETAATHDAYWNAAQTEMLRTGFMHNYMRMYWGKKILEWKVTPEEAFVDTLYLNNKYFLCGRDANAYANVAWIFGLHDRPWGPARPIFGTVRYMNSAGLERKFDMDAFVEKIAALA